MPFNFVTWSKSRCLSTSFSYKNDEDAENEEATFDSSSRRRRRPSSPTAFAISVNLQCSVVLDLERSIDAFFDSTLSFTLRFTVLVVWNRKHFRRIVTAQTKMVEFLVSSVHWCSRKAAWHFFTIKRFNRNWNKIGSHMYDVYAIYKVRPERYKPLG